MKDLEELFNVAHKAGHAVLITGKHGIGKSQRAENFAINNNYHIETLFLSQMEVGDLIGIPINVSTDNGEVMIWTKPIWLERMLDANKVGKECVLFFDELNRASLDVLQAALQLVLEGRIHEHSLPRGKYKTLIIAAQNPSDDDYMVNELDPALLDRFITVKLEVSVSEWLRWARANDINPVVQKFIGKFPDKIHSKAESEEKGSTPRAWVKVSDVLKYTSGDSSVLFPMLEGTVGKSIAVEFVQFYKDHEHMISVKDVKELIKKYYNKKITPEENLERIKEPMKKLLSNADIPIVQNLLYELLAVSVHGKNFLLLNLTIYAVNLEVQTAFAKTIKEDRSKEFKMWVNSNMAIHVFDKMVQVIETKE